MEFKTNKINLTLYASIIVLIFYAITFSGIVYEPFASITERFVNRQEGFIEFIEAIFWLSAFIIYLFLFIQNVKNNKVETLSFWFLFLAIWCFMVFGEEISWGQHILGFNSPDYINEINKQHETNLHNLYLPSIIGLSKNSILYPMFEKLYILPQLVFYLVCSIVWIVIPTVKWSGTLSHSKIIQTVPVHNKGIVVFLCINLIAYIIIDKLFFDVAEIFELSLSLTAIISALYLWPLRSNLRLSSNN